MCSSTSEALASEANPESGCDLAAAAVNELGLELLTKSTQRDANALISPYSIQAALAMTYAGADGETKAEMGHVLHFGANERALHSSFGDLQKRLEAIASKTAAQAEQMKKFGPAPDPVKLTVANRLFGQSGYEFRAPFLAFVQENYGAPLQPLDFARDPSNARVRINSWVEEQTKERIRDLIPPDGLDKDSRLVLVNAVYLKAPWAEQFQTELTKPAAFHLKGGNTQQVPTMSRTGRFGYEKQDGFTVVTVQYSGGEIQLIILLPDDVNGLAALESRLNSNQLSTCAKAKPAELVLFLPRFKVEPPLFRLANALQQLGMKSAFDKPPGSANFERMAPRRPNDYLYLSEVFHKTFLSLDEKGTEAAAATAAVMARVTSAIGPRPTPIEVRIDHPFLYAIQHRPSGACLFLGRMTDPR